MMSFGGLYGRTKGLDELLEMDERLESDARYKLTGNYAQDTQQLRRGRRAYWELYNSRDDTGSRNNDNYDYDGGNNSRNGFGNGRRRSRRSAHEGEEEEDEEETKRISLQRVSQRLLLERQDLETKIAETRREFGKLARRKIVLEEEWKKLQVDRANLEEDKKRFQAARRSTWFQSNLLPTSDLRRVRLNVGGQLFETSEKVLKRDPGSLLAALVQNDGPIKADEQGCFVIERDWFLFRHVLAFLRDGILPQASEAAGDQLISSLYKEAEYYNLESLRCAIREYLDPYQIVEKSAAVPLSQLHKLEAKMTQSLLKQRNNEFYDDGIQYPNRKPKSSSKNKNASASSLDWWTKGKYNGKDFTRVSESSIPRRSNGSDWKKRGSSLEYAKSLAEETKPFTTRTTWFKEW